MLVYLEQAYFAFSLKKYFNASDFDLKKLNKRLKIKKKTIFLLISKLKMHQSEI